MQIFPDKPTTSFFFFFCHCVYANCNRSIFESGRRFESLSTLIGPRVQMCVASNCLNEPRNLNALQNNCSLLNQFPFSFLLTGMCYTETTRFIVYSFWREVGGLFEIDAKLFIIVITIQSNNALFFFFLFFFN